MLINDFIIKFKLTNSYLEQDKLNQQNMKTTSKINYGLYFIAITLSLWSTISCKKHPEPVASTNPGAAAPTNPGAVTPTQELIMAPCFTDDKLIRYKQKSQNSCLITSIYMLVHSMNGKDTVVSEEGAIYKFDGTEDKTVSEDEEKLTRGNNLKHTLMGDFESDFQDPKRSYTNFKNDVDKLAAILNIGPFVLGINPSDGSTVGHAMLVIGIDKKDGTLIYVDPINPKVNMCRSIFELPTSDLFFHNTCIVPSTKSYTPTQEEENSFQKLKSDGTKKRPEEYKP